MTVWAVYAVDAVRPVGWARFTPHKVRVGHVEATTAAEAEIKAARDYAEELQGKGLKVEARR